MAGKAVKQNPAASIGNATGDPAASAHKLFMTFAGEAIGVTLIAVFADLNEDLGKLLVLVMIGWFLLFLMTNATDLSGLVQKL